MKRIIYAIVGACLLYSCSSTPKEREVTVSNVEIAGTIKDFVKVVDGTYSFTNNGKEAFITVQIELIEEPDQPLCIVTWEQYRKYPELRLNAVGKNGHIFDTGTYGFNVEKEQLQKFTDLLSGKVGGKKSVSFKWNYFGVSKETGVPIFKEATSFEIIEDAFVYCDAYAEMVENGMIELPNNETETPSSSSNAKSENWDELLNSYEKYVDQYIKYVKKINDGDISAMTEYTNLLKKTTDLADKMGKATGQLTSGQMNRYLDINNKFTNAMVDVAQ